jgi:hypothetical protein
LLIEISKKTPFLLIKKALLLIEDFELEKSLLILQSKMQRAGNAYTEIHRAETGASL